MRVLCLRFGSAWVWIALLYFFPIWTSSGQVLSPELTKKLETLSPAERIEYLGQLCWELRDSSRELSRFYGKTALEWAQGKGFYHQEAEVCNYLGIGLLYYDFDMKSALAYFSRGLEAAMAGKDSIEIGYSYNNTGDVYYLTQNILLAELYADSAMSYFEAINHPAGKAYTYINYGQIARAKRHYEEALNFFAKAIHLHDSLSINPGLSAANLESARTKLAQGQYQEALPFYEKSLKLTRHSQNKVYYANSLVGIADVRYRLGDYEEALYYYDSALVLNLEKNQRPGIIACVTGKALVWSKLGQRDLGEKELAQARKTAVELGMHTYLVGVQKAAIEFYENLGDYKTAVREVHDILQINDSLILNQQFETLQELQEKEKVRNNLNHAQWKIKSQKVLGITLAVVLFLIALFSVLLYRKNRQQKNLNGELHQLNEGKDKLFSIISHDLRTPLAGIMQYIELLRAGDLSPELQSRYMKQLETATLGTHSLLENLLNLSAFRTGRIEYTPENFKISRVLDAVKQTLDQNLQAKELRIKTEIVNDQFFGDSKMLEVVVRNLISNAIKYSRQGGEIVFRAYHQESFAFFEIIDQGLGMTPELVSKLDASDIVSSSLGTAGEKGTGIGLGLCKEFVKRHGGRIELVSKPGLGSTFRVILPQP